MNWVLCPVRNNLELTKRAIASFRKQDIAVNILILANDPQDGIMPWIATQTDLSVSNQRPPLSVAAAWNFGLRWVFKESPYCLVVNNDIELLPQTYSTLLQDGGNFVTAVGVNELEKLQDFKWSEEVFKSRPHPDFSCFLIRKELYNKIGPFDENFKGAYCEDSDYHCRMHRAKINAKSLNIPFFHHASGTLKSCNEIERRSIGKQADLNREYFRRKWGFKIGGDEYKEFFGEI